MSSEVIAKAILAIPCGFAFAIFITPIFVFLRKIFYAPFTNKKLLEEAKNKGNIVKAKLIKRYDDMIENGDFGLVSSGEEIGIYQYEYNQKKYKYWASTTGRSNPDEITLYFIKNPRKARSANELYISARSPWIKSYLIIAACIAFIIFVILLIDPNLLDSFFDSLKK